MNYIILDLEWNQGNSEVDKEEEDIPFEIIEIGAVKLNSEKQITDQFNHLVKPQVYHELHHITKKLIHMQMEEFEKEEEFPIVANEFLEWCGNDYIFGTWGPLDLTELQKNMRHYKMDLLTDRPLKFYDIQKLFSLAFEDHKSRRTLEYAVDFLHITKDIPFHRAYSDAYYTAKIFEQIKNNSILKNYSFDCFVKPLTRKDEIHIIFDTYAKYISRVFQDKVTAMEDREVTSCRCYICHKNIKRKIKWFSPNGKHYYSVSYCDKHGFMKGKIRIRKTEQDEVYVIKTEKFISPEDVLKVKAMLGRAKENKKRRKQNNKK